MFYFIEAEELHSMLEMKEERIKVLETQIEDKKKIVLEGKCNTIIIMTFTM